MKRLLKYSALAILTVALTAFVLDDLVARIRSDRFQTVKVDQFYAVTNRWNQVEYSMGGVKDERCVNALFPHFGSRPCWYVNGHRYQYVRAG